MRLNVFIAKSGFSSRRKADFFIKGGNVRVNGAIVREPWLELKNSDSVEVDQKTLSLEENIYIVFNKPKGVTVTLKDRFAKKKITEFIPKKYGRLYPVGRLDKNSRGLIILTNDGDFCYRLTHPKFEVDKEYLIRIREKPQSTIINKLKKGVIDGPDTLRVKSASIEASGQSGGRIRVIISEGKKRHLRRLFKAIGFNVTDVQRVRIGSLKLGTLTEGSFKILNKKTACSLYRKPECA